MLAHWHYILKGLKPFQDAIDPLKLEGITHRANLKPEQVQLVKATARWIVAQGRSALFTLHVQLKVVVPCLLMAILIY